MLKPSQILLGYSEWSAVITEAELSDDERKWLAEWNFYDLSTSPTDDEQRKLIRYGHYLGWFAAMRTG